MANKLAPLFMANGRADNFRSIYKREIVSKEYKKYDWQQKNWGDEIFGFSSLTIILLYQKFWGKSNFEVRIFLEVKFWKNGIGNIYLYIYLYTIISINLFYLLAAFFAAARSVSGARRAKKRSVYFAYCYILFYITIFILIL